MGRALASLYKQARDATGLLPSNTMPVSGLAEKGKQETIWNSILPYISLQRFMRVHLWHIQIK